MKTASQLTMVGTANILDIENGKCRCPASGITGQTVCSIHLIQKNLKLACCCSLSKYKAKADAANLQALNSQLTSDGTSLILTFRTVI